MLALLGWHRLNVDKAPAWLVRALPQPDLWDFWEFVQPLPAAAIISCKIGLLRVMSMGPIGGVG
jgi:hypothetical protein